MSDLYLARSQRRHGGDTNTPGDTGVDRQVCKEAASSGPAPSSSGYPSFLLVASRPVLIAMLS